MKKNIYIIIKLLYLIFSICVVYITFFNLYSWLAEDYSAEIQSGTFIFMLIWFVLYCFIVYKAPCDTILPYQGEKKTLTFMLPLCFMVMNIFLEATIWSVRTDEDLPIEDNIVYIKIIFIALAFIFIGILFYFSMKNQIYIWYPVSLYCTIYAIPGSDYTGGLSGVGFVVVYLAGIVIFSIIEYGIMLYLNRKKWYIPKDKRQKNE